MPTMLIPIAGFRDHHHSSEIKPDDWNQWIALGGAAIGIASWLWRRTVKAFAVWLWNGMKAPQRIEEIMARLECVQHDLHTAIGLARATWDSLPGPVWQSDALGMCVHVNLAYRELLGYQFTEVSGLQWKQVVYPEDKDLVYEEWESSVKDKRPFDLRLQVDHQSWKDHPHSRSRLGHP
jgi:PAS domain-containing protein